MAGYSLRRWIVRFLPARLLRDRAGGVLVMVGVLTPVVFGVSALGMDATMWYMERREAQTFSDTGALAGAHLAVNNASDTEIENGVEATLNRNGFDVRPGDTITVNRPPSSGKYAGDTDYVEVVVRRQAQLLLGSVLLDDAGTIGVRSVAGAVVSGEHCVVSLDDQVDRALEFTGTADVSLDCGVAANSNSSQSIYIGGNAQLTADPAQTFGDMYVGSNASLVTNSPPRTYAQKVDDPYGPNGRNLQVPNDYLTMPCASATSTGSKSEQYLPGRYCGGIDVKSGFTADFASGVYYIDGGSFKAAGNATLQGDDVTFILTGDSPSDVASLDISGGATLDLHAPDGDPAVNEWAGILFFQDPKAEVYQGGNIKTNKILGGTNADLTGAIYFPRQEVVFTGGASGTNKCLQIVGRKVTFDGNGHIDQDPAACKALGVQDIAQVQVKLVE